MSEDSCLNYICLLEQAGNTSYYNDQNDLKCYNKVVTEVANKI